MAKSTKATARRAAKSDVPADQSANATRAIGAAMNGILADVFALYLKTKTFHWHVNGDDLGDHRLLIDEQAAQLYAMIDPIAERVGKVVATVLRMNDQIDKRQRVAGNNADDIPPREKLAEVREDNKALAHRLRQARDVCEEHHFIATASLIEVWIDEADQRTRLLSEPRRHRDR